MAWKRWATIGMAVTCSLPATSTAAEYLGPDRIRSVRVWLRRQRH